MVVSHKTASSPRMENILFTQLHTSPGKLVLGLSSATLAQSEQ